MPDPLGSFDYTWPFYLSAMLGYIVGSIPFGLLLVRLAGQGDIRSVGSGNIGATNVLRTGRKSLAAATLILDGGKGVVLSRLCGALRLVRQGVRVRHGEFILDKRAHRQTLGRGLDHSLSSV